MSDAMTVKEKQELKGQESTRPGRVYLPDVDVAESQDKLLLWADMPGVDEKSISVTLDDGELTIEGRVAVDDYANLQPLYTEYNVGDYVRRFRVSTDLDVERIQARVVHGVLEIELPKAERVKSRKIEVKVA
jgi:HSP20 family molecular chaperone IbpA